MYYIMIRKNDKWKVVDYAVTIKTARRLAEDWFSRGEKVNILLKSGKSRHRYSVHVKKRHAKNYHSDNIALHIVY